MDKYQYLTVRRILLFLDEWLFYLLIILMYIKGISYYVIIPIVLIGAIMIYISYRSYWALLKKFKFRR